MSGRKVWRKGVALITLIPVDVGAQGIAVPDTSRDIIVTANPDGLALAGVTPERTLEGDDVSAYGVDSVQDLLNEVQAEQGDGDEPPVVLVDGRRVEDLGDAGDLPAEAVAKLEVLPRGTGPRVGAAAGKRVYNIVLRKSFRSEVLTASTRLATDGGWASRSGAAVLTRIAKGNRLNITLRARDEDMLLESERGIVQPPALYPFSLTGNVFAGSGLPGDEIDPALSALVGHPVAIASVPAIAVPALADFAQTADQPSASDAGRFRSLRPAARSYDLRVSLNRRLSPHLSLSASGRLGTDTSRYLLGPRAALILLPTGSAYSPFTTDAVLARLAPDPLQQRTRNVSGDLNASLSADLGRWQLTVTGRYEAGDRRTNTDRDDLATTPRLSPDPFVNPFTAPLGDLFPLGVDFALARTNLANARALLTGSPVKLPAGPLRVTAGAGWTRSSARSVGGFVASGATRTTRTEVGFDGSIELPLASRREGFLSTLGELSLNLDGGITDFSDARTARRWGGTLNWRPIERVQVTASRSTIEQPPAVTLLNDPVIITPGVRYFDVLTGETVDVTAITGGNAELRSARVESSRYALSISALKSINLQLNADYSDTNNRNGIAALPPASAPVLAVFPERFIRDATGRLTAIDGRLINLAGQAQRQVRYGFSLNAKIGQATAAARTEASGDPGGSGEEAETPQPAATTRGPLLQTRVQATFSHTIILSNEVVIRAGLPSIDLLSGGAIGFGGGSPRHLINGSLGVSRGGSGVRLSGTWRSEALLQTELATSALRFAPYATFDLRGFVDGRTVSASSKMLRGARITLSAVNLLNTRQRVRDDGGATPLRYQPGYRDPIGRTIELEIRKAF